MRRHDLILQKIKCIPSYKIEIETILTSESNFFKCRNTKNNVIYKKNNNNNMMRTSKKMCAIAENINKIKKKVVSIAD